MNYLEELEKRWVRVGELMEASGKSLEEILALYASTDECPPFPCNECPLRLKGICKPMHIGDSCFKLWLN